MGGSSRNESYPVLCIDCDEEVVFREYPYNPNYSYVLECDCTIRKIDVTECVDGNSLLQPMSGKWSTFEGRDRQ